MGVYHNVRHRMGLQRPRVRITGGGTVRRGTNATTVSVRGRKKTASALKRKTGSKTKTAVKLNHKVKTSKDGPISVSMVKVPMRGARFGLGKFKRLTAPMFYVTNASGYLSWANSYQALTSMSSLYSANEIQLLFNLYAANVPASTTGATVAKLYMRNCFAETLITNQTNDVVHMTLYDVMVRRDLTTSSTAEGLYINPAAAWQQGSIDAGATNAFEIVGSTPFQTPGFTEYYKVFKITDVDLHSGGHHRHKIYSRPLKMINNELITTLTANSATGVLGGWTTFTLVVCHGFPDNLSGGTTVTTASGKIDWVVRRQYEFYPVGSERTIVNFNDTIPQNATEAIINDLTGAATTVTTA